MVSTRSGFTFIEMILVLAIVLVFGVMTAAFSADFFFRKNIDGVSEMFGSMVRKAELYTLEGREGSAWSVAVRDGALVLFRGADFETRDIAFDESYSLPGGITVTGFDSLTAERGTLAVTGTFGPLAIENGGRIRTFIFSQYGALEEL